MRKIILYIVYGDDQAYYDGAKFSFLTFMNWIPNNEQIEFVILTQKPKEFSNYPVSVYSISNQQINEWSINGDYHFRIKNRGMAYIMDELGLKGSDKIIFFDTDTYFNKKPLNLFNLIDAKQALLYLNEGLIYDRPRFDIYVKSLENISIKIDGESYKLSKKSSMWGSLMIGLMPNMRESLDWSDKLMLELFKIVPAHTIEPFSLSETLLRKYSVIEGKKYVSLYSTSRKKEYCRKILVNFFKNYNAFPISEQIQLAQKVNMKRPFYVVLKQRFLKS